MENNLFRKSSVERISSPEQLQDYMRVTSPGIWMVLAAVAALLIGLIVCSATGKLETTLPVQAIMDDGVVSVQIPAGKLGQVKEGMPLRMSGREAPIEHIYQSEDGPFIATLQMDGVPDGLHDAVIVQESISPISFLLND